MSFYIFLALMFFGAFGLGAMVIMRIRDLNKRKITFVHESGAFDYFIPLKAAMNFIEACEEEHMPRAYKYLCRYGKTALVKMGEIPENVVLPKQVSRLMDAVKGRSYGVGSAAASTSRFLDVIADHKQRARRRRREA